ncbi:creatininase family protein [Candidatus Poribacteria bacterium]
MLSIYNTSKEIADSGTDTAVIPLGSVEGKGPHLPLGSDLIVAEAFAREYCRDKDVYLLPTLPFGTSECQRGFAGTVYLENETLWDVIYDLVDCLKRYEFKRVIVLNFCSYNWVVKPAVREINLGSSGVNVIWVEPKHLVGDILAERVGQFSDHHAGVLETSLILHLNEGLVTQPVEDCLPNVSREYLDYVGMKKVSPTGVWGKPSLASRELGAELFGKMVERTDEYVWDAFSLFPDGSERWTTGAQHPVHHSADSFYNSPAPDQKADILDWTKSYKEIAERKPDIALVTITAVEQHSYHLPLGTDFFSGVVRSRLLAEKIGAYLSPPLPIVTSWCHTGFRGSLMFRSPIARKLIMDVVGSLYEDGFRKVVMLCAHGGNWIAKPTAIELNRKYPELKLIYAGGDMLSYRGQGHVDTVHSGAGETAFIMDYYPECLKEQMMTDSSPEAPASYLDYVGMRGVSPAGVWGYPSKARKGTGIQSVETSVERMAEYIERTFNRLEKM